MTGPGDSGPGGTGPKQSTSPFIRLDRKIAADERGGVMHRWNYGRELLKVKADRQQLPHGMVADLIKAADRVGLKLSEREIQRRIKLATVYDSEAKVRHAVTDFGSWRALVNANFPPVESDDPDDLEADGISTEAPDAWEQLSLIPGLGEVLKVRGRSIPLAEATIADVEAYRDMYAGIHSNFAKRLALIENALRIMREAGGDSEDGALDAWRRGVGAP